MSDLILGGDKADWGDLVGIDQRAPRVAGDPQFREWWATYLRMGANPAAALVLTQMNAEIDVRSVLPFVGRGLDFEDRERPGGGIRPRV